MRLTRTVVVLFALCLPLFCTGCFDDPQKDAANKQKVEKLLAHLPEGWKAEIEVKGDTLVIRNFSAEWHKAPKGEPSSETLALNFDELRAEGVDFTAADTPGAKSPAKKVTLKNLRSRLDSTAGSQGDAVVISYALDLLEVRNPEGNLAGFMAVVEGTAEPQSLFDTLDAWKVGPLRAENALMDISYSYFGVTSKLQRMSFASASFLGCRDYKAEKLSVMSLGVEVFALDSQTCRLVALPNIAAFFNKTKRFQEQKRQSNATDPSLPEDRDKKLFADFLRAEPLRVEGLTTAGMRIRPMSTDSIQVAETSFDCFMSPDSFKVDLMGKGISLPTEVLAKIAPPSEWGLHPGEALLVEQGVHMELKPQGPGGIGVHSGYLRLPGRGGVEASLNMSFPRADQDFPALPDSGEHFFVDGGRLLVEDIGGVEKFLAVRGWSKEQLLLKLFLQISGAGVGAEVQKALGLVVMQGGRADLHVVCEPPVLLSDLAQALEKPPAGWKLNLKYTPPTAK